QPAQMMAHLANLVRQLPLLEPIPPVTVGAARRLDSVTELCGLAKRSKNCLPDFISMRRIMAVRPFTSGTMPGRRRRAWSPVMAASVGPLKMPRGPRPPLFVAPENAELPPARLQEIHRAFTAVGIPT